MDITDEKATAYLRDTGLASAPFICLIPRLRYTPYHQIRKTDWSEAEVKRRSKDGRQSSAVSGDDVRTSDHRSAVVRSAACRREEECRPQDYVLASGRSVVCLQARHRSDFECHSPILAATQGTPCTYIYQPEVGIKGRMWEDLGLGAWYFAVEKTSSDAIAHRVLEIYERHEASKAKVRGAVKVARQLQDQAMSYVQTVAAR
jgi:hypothetical protein